MAAGITDPTRRDLLNRLLAGTAGLALTAAAGRPAAALSLEPMDRKTGAAYAAACRSEPTVHAELAAELRRLLDGRAADGAAPLPRSTTCPFCGCIITAAD